MAGYGWTTAAAVIGGISGLAAPYLSDRYIASRELSRGTSIDTAARPGWERIIYILLGAAVCGVGAWRFSLPETVLLIITAVLLLTIADIDNRCRLIPNPFVVTLLVLGAAGRLTMDGLKGLAGMGIALVMAVVLLLLASVLTSLIMKMKNTVGAGDVKLILVMAIASGIPGFFYGMAAMAVCMLVYSVVGLLLKRLTPASFIPLGGSIVFGYLIAMLF